MGNSRELAPGLDAIVLAAGKGTRMRSELAKVLHPICGWTMLRHVAEALRHMGGGERIFVLGHSREAVQAEINSWKLKDFSFEVAVQAEQKGTGHAVRCGLEALTKTADRPVLVVSGDVPLLTQQSIELLLETHKAKGAAVTVAVMRPVSPFGYGRVVVKDGLVEKIVEEKDATAEERAIPLVNGGIYIFNSVHLRSLAPKLKPSPKTKEIYLTDLIALARDEGLSVATQELPGAELLGVNDFEQLVGAAREVRRRRAKEFLRNGVLLHDPGHFYMDMDVEVAAGAVIESNVHLVGATKVAAGAWIELGCRIEDSEICERARIKAYSCLEKAYVGAGAQVGPMARLRPGSSVGQEAKIGNFVELKSASIGAGSKVSHLTYIGDAQVGSDSNIGCGFITCNYDGTEKHRTTIGDRVFIGSDVQAVAPISIGDDAYVASGTTVTKDVPATGDLVIGRVRQENKAGYAKRLKAMKEAAKGKK